MDRLLLFKELTEAFGPSGFEHEPRKLMRKYLEPNFSVQYDRLGSIVGERKRKEGLPKLLFCAHMDEIGFMVQRIVETGNKGYIKFLPIGGWWPGVVPGQRVKVRTKEKDFIGVVGIKPPHELTPEEEKKLVEIKDMFIDVGITKERGAAEMGIKPGDPIVPYLDFSPLENGLFLAKAWDDRMGCSVLAEVAEKIADIEHPNNLYFVGTVQEEVGLRGARTAANLVKPDIAFAIDVSIARDIPPLEAQQVEYLGNGVAVLIHDRRMIPNIKLRDEVIRILEEEKIPYHLTSIKGTYDTAEMHLHNIGVPSLALGIPTRYIHSWASVISEKDYDNLIKAVIAIIRNLTKEKVSYILKFE